MIIPQADRLNTSSRVGYGVFFIALSILFLDLLSKYLTQHYLPLIYSQPEIYPYGGIGVFKNFLGIEFSITHAINFGAAWNILNQYQIFLLVFRIFLVAGLAVYVFFFNKTSSQVIPLVFIIAGALGNIVDYFLYGHVVDMFHFVFWGYRYPVFNVADSAITLGIIGIFLQNLRYQR